MYNLLVNIAHIVAIIGMWYLVFVLIMVMYYEVLAGILPEKIEEDDKKGKH